MGGTVGSAADKVGGTVGTAARRASVPALVGTAAAAGLAGGVALGARALRGKTPLTRSRGNGLASAMGRGSGKALRSVAHEVKQVGKEVGKTGFRVGIGDVSMEVQKGKGDKDTRDSPLEVLLHGLTARRAKR